MEDRHKKYNKSETGNVVTIGLTRIEHMYESMERRAFTVEETAWNERKGRP